MKSTAHFKNTIKAYLDQQAETDVLFLLQYSKPKKNMDDCITYILNWVKKSGCNGFTDDEIFGQAIHYFQEDNIEVGNPLSCNVVVNHTVELTAEEKEQARKEAIQQVHNEVYTKLKTPARKPQTKQTAVTNQLNLFDE
jgi:hypothetical protein